MSLPIISVNNVAKSFKVADSNTQTVGIGSTFWALKDISFDVLEGEVLGIIGRNGSGKSTLLKILSNIVKPSSGTVMLRGNVTSILEIGSGFHPELTGIENIFLYGSMLGMSRKEINQLLEEIVDFSEIGDFVNEQVKNYSSGMYLRLALSVVLQAHISTLIVDEVLAVGDAGFKKKTFDKISSLIKKRGVSVVMVSHGMNDLIELSNRCIYLEKGRIVDEGLPDDIISRYLVDVTSGNNRKVPPGSVKKLEWDNVPEAPGNNQVRLIGVAIKQDQEEQRSDIFIEDALFFEVEFVKLTDNIALNVTLVFYDALQTPLFFATSLYNKAEADIDNLYQTEKGRLKYSCFIPSFFNAGHYSFQVKFGTESEPELYVHSEKFSFSVKKNPILKYQEIKPVILRPSFNWVHQRIL
jgi:lipopolysaccharide transport system ATP-binding protein